MNAQKYLEDMYKIQDNLLDYLDDEGKDQEKFQSLISILDQMNIHNNQHDTKLILHLLLQISNNHHRNIYFMSKIFEILQYFKDDLKKYFSNSELFYFFKSNKRILLFLLEENIMTIDDFFIRKITTEKYIKAKYPQYFSPEIRPYINSDLFPKIDESKKDDKSKIWIEEIKKDLPNDFYENRKSGENDNNLCEIIRKDSISDFIVYINKHSISNEAKIEPPIYETNEFLLRNKDTTLIEYAAFFGSIQIFNYLKANGAKLSDSLRLYVIHENNAEIFGSIDEHLIESDNNSLLIESLKCHHNNLADYIRSFRSRNDEINADSHLYSIFKYFNFKFIQAEKIDGSSFYFLCKYDYYQLVNLLLNEKYSDINKLTVFISNI